MRKVTRKLLGKLNIATTLFLAVAIIGGLGGATYVLASNVATQSASSAQATTITVVGKVADTAITTITFPQGAPSAIISVPYNDVDLVADAQVLHATTSEPVVRLKNTSAGSLKVWLSITTWANGVAASEDFELVPVATTTITVVDDVLSTNGNAATVDTTKTIAAAAYNALYLELVLSASAGKTGTSTLTILGETP